jgi:hypothetical protein
MGEAKSVALSRRRSQAAVWSRQDENGRAWPKKRCRHKSAGETGGGVVTVAAILATAFCGSAGLRLL